jgi:hypothetical protein
MSDFGLICAVAGLVLLAIFGDPGANAADPAFDTVRSTRSDRILEQLAAVAGVALLIAAGIFQTGQSW